MIIVNGDISHEESIKLDSGYNFGRGVFETILVKDRPVFLKQHCERMKKGLTVLGIDNHVDEEYIIKFIEKYEINNCVLKVIATEKNIVMSTRQIPYKPEDYIRGFNVKLSALRRNPYSHVVYIKSLNYTDNLIEKERASREGYDEAVFLNTHEKIAEGCVSNVFFVKSDTIYTPSISCGILNGIVRGWVIENFKVCEGEFSLEDIQQANEAFVTNSIMGVMKVRSFEGLKEYESSEISTSIRETYEKYIAQF